MEPNTSRADTLDALSSEAHAGESGSDKNKKNTHTQRFRSLTVKEVYNLLVLSAFQVWVAMLRTVIFSSPTRFCFSL